MTNVKIKLMFFVLNALLTADFVHARPYNSSNTDQIYFNNTTGENYSIPVEVDSDTLVVANDDQTQEQQNKNSKTAMDSMVNAEQGRDELILSKKQQKEPAKAPEIPKEDAVALEKQLNISSPLLEEIIDSETGREETLTDIMFRPELEGPRFEFLISGKINDTGNSSVIRIGDNELGKFDKNTSEVIKKSDYVELVAVGKNSKISENKSAYNLLNITGHEVENDLDPDPNFLSVFAGYTDLQTLFLACAATLLPLLAILFATLCVRCLIRRLCPRSCRSSVSTDSESSDQKADNNQRKSVDASTNTADRTLETDCDAPAANGSIITMTLKNNHLIVETEERSDITRNGRETKMKYSPDNDGIFVVEVQQSAVYRSSSKSLNSPAHDPQISTNQALIHRVPEERDNKIVKTLSIDEGSERSSDRFEKGKGLALSNTGLSISDLSMSSIGSHNASYSYGSQVGYEQGPFGYPVYAGYDVPKEYIGDGIIHDHSREPLIAKTPTDPDKPVVTAAIFKQDSIIGSDALQGPGYCIEGSSDGPLLSDVQAREVSLQHIHDQMEKKLENGTDHHEVEKVESPKKQLCRADSLPMRLENEKPPEPVMDKAVPMDTITEDETAMNNAILKGKRASLPIIRTEMYESVKDVLIPTGSPKFEKFANEVSPSDTYADNPPPMITITEEESPKHENGSS
ncbi:hypothetical protein JYU34_005554 [Plutella xylostella]|uniref:Uncharacterized protein n=1 Tax=Plutella xylostella TaxID=51655 RepID=A0ABQ7QTH7_PLUXY|nr:hypothetical protein JYU34_005554 [Plutella xylostella]